MFVYIIDGHVHFRGADEPAETIEHGLEIAEKAGYTACLDIRNIKYRDKWREDVERCLKVVEKNPTGPVKYGFYIVLQNDREQVKEAARIAKKHSPYVHLKDFFGDSTNNYGIPKEAQENVFRWLGEEDYRGVVMAHCEDNSLFANVWDPLNPITHAHARKPESETPSVVMAINLAEKTGFQGHLHIGHVSVPASVYAIADAKAKGREVSCGATLHHLTFSREIMNSPDGLQYKMNPALRPPEMVGELYSCLEKDLIDNIETDHAPHRSKTAESHPSGIISMHAYPLFIGSLKTKGFTDKQIRKLTFDNANKIFGLNLQPREVKLSYEHLEKLAEECERYYGFDPWKKFREENRGLLEAAFS